MPLFYKSTTVFVDPKQFWAAMALFFRSESPKFYKQPIFNIWQVLWKELPETGEEKENGWNFLWTNDLMTNKTKCDDRINKKLRPKVNLHFQAVVSNRSDILEL